MSHLVNLILIKRKKRESRERQEVTPEFGRHLEMKFYAPKFRVLQELSYCKTFLLWGRNLSYGKGGLVFDQN
jgi:hypothetical protein